MEAVTGRAFPRDEISAEAGLRRGLVDDIVQPGEPALPKTVVARGDDES